MIGGGKQPLSLRSGQGREKPLPLVRRDNPVLTGDQHPNRATIALEGRPRIVGIAYQPARGQIPVERLSQLGKIIPGGDEKDPRGGACRIAAHLCGHGGPQGFAPHPDRITKGRPDLTQGLAPIDHQIGLAGLPRTPAVAGILRKHHPHPQGFEG